MSTPIYKKNRITNKSYPNKLTMYNKVTNDNTIPKNVKVVKVFV